MDLARYLVQQLVKRIRGGDFSLKELGKSLLKSCASIQERLAAFISLNEEHISREIHRLERLLHNESKDNNNMNLLGVPLALADNLATSDQKTTCASRLLSSYQPPFDAISPPLMSCGQQA